jgi:hypothetical protein
VGKMAKTSSNAGNLPTTTIQHTTFVHRIFLVRTKLIQKANTFSKMTTLSTTWFSQFAESILEIFIGKLGKTMLVREISLSALLPGAVVSCKELQIAQNQSCWKEDNARFP